MQNLLSSDWGIFGIFFLTIVLFLGLADFLLKKFKVHPNTTRRIVHILVAILVSIAPFIFENYLQPFVLAIIFIIINFLSLGSENLKGIHGTERVSYGTIYFPISFAVLVLWFWDKDPAILITAMLIMGFADPIASWVGENAKNPKVFTIISDKKSLQGSFAMFLISFIVATFGMLILRKFMGNEITFSTAILIGFITAIFATVAETISHQGTDNLTVPLGAGLILDFLYHSPNDMRTQLILWMLITTVIAIVAFKAKSLSLDGAVGAWLLGTIVFGIGGIEWMIPMIIFFTTSSILSHIGGEHKKILNDIFEKTGKRDFYQVFANGGFAVVTTLLFYFTKSQIWFVIYLGTVASAMADTWGTELGTFSKKLPRSILNFKKVPMGASGGITFLGTSGAIFGSFFIAISGILFYNYSNTITLHNSLIIWITVAGIFGMAIDSILGLTIQAQYKCPICKKITEKTSHCGENNLQLFRGIKWFNNDVVNLSCTFSGGVIIGIIYLVG
ncbi:MAG: DUF92 domain-containing protein [Candidatus Marinimicrobia bacterium]|nr:DUF92 domain-containing protein [Candidatus Neomarinimicrobiota bacterium]